LPKPPTSGKKRGGYVGASCVCPACKKGDAEFVNHRGKGFTSLLGPLRFMRSYYYCRACGHGYFPWDQTLGVFEQTLTPAANEVVCMHGVQSAFAEASERALYKSAGLRLSESTVERTTESAGERLAQLLQDRVTFGKEEHWDWERDALGRSCAYVSLDAVAIRQQGLRGAAADGRMAYVGMVYNPRGAARTLERRKASTPHQVRYLAGFYDLDELGLQLRRQAAQVGWDEAEQQIALSDGGSGLEEFFKKNFPLATIIIDFWHVKEYLVELGKAFFGEATDAAKQWIAQRCHQLKAEGGAAVLAVLETLDVASRSESLRELQRVTTGYFRNHQHKMNYPQYVAHGWQIGSGPVESACGTVVSNRLCGSGMRWGSPGSDYLCHLRALFLSQRNQWETFWTAYPN
jgi:hypothetical protein